ncbi:MAG: FitA-like ribbon-helix-helix domain-containing protein [Dehalococcoidia bacterium]
MPNILVRNVPDGVHPRLLERATARGLSLQTYLRAELARLAETETLEEVLARIRTNSGGRLGVQDTLDALDEAWAERMTVLAPDLTPEN